MRYYLAGPMAGLPNHNYPAFQEAAAQLRAEGYEIVSPAELHPDTLSITAKDEAERRALWCRYLRADLIALLECDGIILLQGWHESEGACLELDVAKKVGLEVQFITNLAEERRARGVP